MNPNDDFGLRVADWLRDEAEPVGAGYLDDVLAQTRGAPQRSAWSSLERWLPVDIAFPSRRLSLLPALRVLVALALVAALAILAILAAGSRPRRLPEPFGPAANGVILSEGPNADIYVSAADGANTRPLITGPTEDVGPWFTHDGTRFIFWRMTSSIAGLPMLASADGSDIRALTTEPLQYPDWAEFSPRDDRVAVVHRMDGRRIVSIIAVATGEIDHHPVPNLDVDNNVLWLPPTGEALVFTARADSDSSTGAALYRMQPDGSGLRQILSVREEDWPYLGLEISHDGKQLTYWMYEADDSSDRWGAHVHLVDMATGMDRRVTFDPANDDESELRFSPDGSTGVILAANGKGAYLQLVDLAGTMPPRRVGPPLRGDEGKALSFSPDGRQVILVLDNDEPLFIDVATGEMTTGPTAWTAHPTWQRLGP